MKSKSNNSKKKCPECHNNMKLIKGQGYSMPEFYDKDKKFLAWSSCSAHLMEYQYWQCIACDYILIEE